MELLINLIINIKLKLWILLKSTLGR